MNQLAFSDVHAIQILGSRGDPTLQVALPRADGPLATTCAYSGAPANTGSRPVLPQAIKWGAEACRLRRDGAAPPLGMDGVSIDLVRAKNSWFWACEGISRKSRTLSYSSPTKWVLSPRHVGPSTLQVLADSLPCSGISMGNQLGCLWW